MQHERPHHPFRRTPGSGALRQYRLYFLGGDGHITYSHEFETEDDARAIRIAEAWLEGRPAELWTGDRKVHSWVGNPDQRY